MRSYLLILVLLIKYSVSYSNQSCEYVSSKSNITILTLSTCNDPNYIQEEQDDFLNFLLTKINTHNLKILILLGQYGVHRPNHNFVSIAYNRLLQPDTVYIQETLSQSDRDIYRLPNSRNWIFNALYPTNNLAKLYKNSTEEGIIIRYYGEFDTTINYYDKVISITKYALANLEIIKKEQKYIQMPYKLNALNISILSLDTTQLNNIEVNKFGFEEHPINKSTKTELIVTFLSLLIVGFLLFLSLRRKHYR